MKIPGAHPFPKSYTHPTHPSTPSVSIPHARKNQISVRSCPDQSFADFVSTYPSLSSGLLLSLDKWEEKHTLQTSFANLLFNPPPVFIASLISPSFITRYGFGSMRSTLHSSCSSRVSKCKSVAFSFVSLSGDVPLRGEMV